MTELPSSDSNLTSSPVLEKSSTSPKLPLAASNVVFDFDNIKNNETSWITRIQSKFTSPRGKRIIRSLRIAIISILTIFFGMTLFFGLFGPFIFL